jgi:acyl carrier protein
MMPDSTAASPAIGPSRAEIDARLRGALVDVLGLDAARVARFVHDSGLFGHLPELDSMAVATLLTEIEDRLGITIEDDEVEGEMLETYGALLAFVEAKAVSA